ncbi:hypothetical protein [Massilia cavernae]|uniref:Outer membrane protein beta-barrel domain-containing protein n=1 Tax=Massilia cavernae TaxID=2320864 RepID=A0A418XY02_9BURK|nr:hypothetical protein [Massilia cavernae]RJG17857.1 hypothetical protein D3872_09770 [Massilia cavernae]
MAALILAAATANVAAVEDTGTPGSGKWEIKAGIGAQRSSGNWELGAPESELNYGAGANTQLVLGVRRVQLRERGQASVSGWGSATAGVKWRFADQDESGVDLGLMPAFSWNLSSSAERRGLVEPGRSIALPLLLGYKRGVTGIYAEAGRNLIEHGDDEWLAGVKLTNDCLPAVECRAEVQHSVARRQIGHTEVNLGFKWRLAEDVILDASAGRDLHPHDATQNQAIFYFGIQLMR